jgi:hypothetical protein
VTPARVLAELEALAARLGVSVRAEPFGRGVLERRGGLCWVDGRPLVVMDEKLAVTDRIGVLAGALSQFDLDGVSLLPVIRERIEEARTGKKRGPRRIKVAARASRPGLARAKPRKKR